MELARKPNKMNTARVVFTDADEVFGLICHGVGVASITGVHLSMRAMVADATDSWPMEFDISHRTLAKANRRIEDHEFGTSTEAIEGTLVETNDSIQSYLDGIETESTSAQSEPSVDIPALDQIKIIEPQ